MRVLLVAAALAGCYSPELKPCSVTCSAGDPCPTDMACGGDHRCHAPDDTSTCPVSKDTVTVHLAGTGSGVVTGAPGINCQPDCTASVVDGATITLSAMPRGGSRFAGWGGACTGTAPCDLVVDGDKTVAANFNLAQPLTVMFTGVGAGEVVSDPAGIDCTVDCTVLFDQDAIVTLTAIPQDPAVFTGWVGGPCSGTSTCVVTLSAAQTVVAEFD